MPNCEYGNTKENKCPNNAIWLCRYCNKFICSWHSEKHSHKKRKSYTQITYLDMHRKGLA